MSFRYTRSSDVYYTLETRCVSVVLALLVLTLQLPLHREARHRNRGGAQHLGKVPEQSDWVGLGKVLRGSALTICLLVRGKIGTEYGEVLMCDRATALRRVERYICRLGVGVECGSAIGDSDVRSETDCRQALSTERQMNDCPYGK